MLTHRTLLAALWGGNYVEQNEYLRVFVGNLRKKIEPDATPRHPHRTLDRLSLRSRSVATKRHIRRKSKNSFCALCAFFYAHLYKLFMNPLRPFYAQNRKFDL